MRTCRIGHRKRRCAPSCSGSRSGKVVVSFVGSRPSPIASCARPRSPGIGGVDPRAGRLLAFQRQPGDLQQLHQGPEQARRHGRRDPGVAALRGHPGFDRDRRAAHALRVPRLSRSLLPRRLARRPRPWRARRQVRRRRGHRSLLRGRDRAAPCGCRGRSGTGPARSGRRGRRESVGADPGRRRRPHRDRPTSGRPVPTAMSRTSPRWAMSSTRPRDSRARPPRASCSSRPMPRPRQRSTPRRTNAGSSTSAAAPSPSRCSSRPSRTRCPPLELDLLGGHGPPAGGAQAAGRDPRRPRAQRHRVGSSRRAGHVRAGPRARLERADVGWGRGGARAPGAGQHRRGPPWPRPLGQAG